MCPRLGLSKKLTSVRALSSCSRSFKPGSSRLPRSNLLKTHCHRYDATNHVYVLAVNQRQYIQLSHHMRNHIEYCSLLGQLAPAAHVTCPRIKEVDRTVELVRPLLVRGYRALMGIDRNDGTGPNDRIQSTIFAPDYRSAIAVPLCVDLSTYKNSAFGNAGRVRDGMKALRSLIQAPFGEQNCRVWTFKRIEDCRVSACRQACANECLRAPAVNM